MQNIISISQFNDRKLLDTVLSRAAALHDLPPADYPKPLQHLTIATVFYEPSTRTRLSFETAIQNLGAHLITVENAGNSSVQKGETLEDTIRTIEAYADGIVLRHPEIGAAQRATAVATVPIINAGDGAGEHPTQALLDLYTIVRAKKSLTGLKIGLVGDLLNGRTVHSLIPLVALYQAELYLIAPKALRLSSKHLKQLEQAGINCTVLDAWDDIITELDVLYMTRVQKERFALIEDYLAVKDSFILQLKTVKTMKPDAIILHPLPRVNEIAQDVDSDPRAHYFQEVKNGLFMRMALLEYLYTN